LLSTLSLHDALPISCARSCRRLVDPARAARTDARMSSVAEIVDDVRARGEDAVRKWSLRFDGVEPARARPGAEVPEEAVLALAEDRKSTRLNSSHLG